MKVQRLLLCLIVTAILIFTMMPAVSAATPAEINNAINKGVTWLVAQQNADGSFSSGDLVANTGLAVLKLEDRAIEQGKSPFDPTYEYSANVQNGLNYLFSHVQPDGGIVTNYQVYDTSIALMAICESGTPNRLVAGTGNPNADGKTYKQIAEAAVHRLVESQSATDGGWYYYLYEDDDATPGNGDQSNTGYATLGLVYAQKLGISIPAGTLGGIGTWVNVIQAPDGSSKYTTNSPWPNTYKTGSLLYEFKMVGAGTGDPRVQNAVGYIQNHWNDNGANQWDGGDQGWKGNYQACFGLMKGFEAQGISTITVGSNPVDWYDDMADWIVATQNADGSWPGDYWVSSQELSTCWALLTLEKTTEVPAAVFDVVKSASDTTVAPGGSVTYTYLVVNTGVTPITNIVLTDDTLGVISGPASGDTSNPGFLDPLETWTYTKTTTLSVTTTNTATATGMDPTGVPLSVTSNPVTVSVTGTPIPSPEFPSLALPAGMILGIAFVVYSLRMTKKD